MKTFCLLTVLIFTALFSRSQDREWLTPCELSEYTETPRLKETMDYCRRLARFSPRVTLNSFGTSAQGRDLPFLIIDRDGLNDPYAIHEAGRILHLMQACIHPGECEGKDAGMMLVRDLIIPGHPEMTKLLDRVSILFIPVFNVDGHERFGPYNRINQNGPREMGWRVTANNLNLNRDYLKADSPEMQAWLLFFNRWMPDFFIDSHTTDGADYQYVLTYLMEIYGEMDNRLTSWSRDVFLKELQSNLDNKGFPAFPYVDFRRWHDPRSGLITEVAPPMLSEGYVALRNRPGLLIETHMLKPYKQRVLATYECLKISMEILNRENTNLRTMIEKADQSVCTEEFLKTPFPLQFETLETDSTMVDFKGVEYQAEKSDISGGTWFKYSNIPSTLRLPYFFRTRPSLTVALPYVYLVPAEWTLVIDRLKIHGIEMKFLETGQMIRISTCKFINPRWQVNPYEGHHPMTNIETEEFSELRWFPSGSAVVRVMQPSARIIPHILEPKGNGSFLYWGFFDAIFEQKEYAESYVLEQMATRMIAESPSLKTELDKKKASDTAFARNPQAVLNWFYNQSPYVDQRKMIYPVGKIYDKNTAASLLNE